MKIVIPKGICLEAKEYMKGIISVLKKQEIITSLDTASIELIAYTYHTYITATKTLLSEGYEVKSERGYMKAHPAVKTQLDAQVQLTKLLDSFGLSPKARKDIIKSKEKTHSPIDDFINRTREVR